MNRLAKHAPIAVAALALAFAITAFADIPAEPRPAQPVKQKENTLKLQIIRGADTQEAQLWLPMDMMGVAQTTDANPSLGTVVAGLAMSGAMVLGGLWLVRTRKRIGTGATATAAMVLAVLGGTATFALANAGPPRNYKPVDPGTLRLAAPKENLEGTVRFYYGGYENGVVRLVLPPEPGSDSK